MAPDRRFGLPHPLDADPSEDSSSPRKPGLWETFKRALGSAAASNEPSPGPPLPRPQANPRPPATPVTSRPPAPAESAPPAKVAGPPPEELRSKVPFLEDLPFEGAPAPPPAPEMRDDPPSPAPDGPVALPDLRESGTAALPEDPVEPPLRPPRVARGIASFSRNNAEREKKFAHLLRDEPGADGKGPRAPRRRR